MPRDEPREEQVRVTYTRQQAAKRLGLNVTQVNYREIRAGIRPSRDVSGRVVYTEEDVVKMARVLERHFENDEISDVDVAGQAFDAFADGKTVVDLVRARLVLPDQGEALREKYARASGGVLLSTKDVDCLAALLAAPSLKTGDEIVQAVAAGLSKRAPPIASPIASPPKPSTAIPRCWTEADDEP